MSDVRHLASIDDLTSEQILSILRLAERLRAERITGQVRHPLTGKTIAMIFEKPSLRTRVTFDVGAYQLGAHAVYLSSEGVQVGSRESVPDIARNLSRWVDSIVARTFSHDTIVGLAEHATVPVINALSDHEHPCQALAFGQLVLSERGSLAGTRVAFIGDGNNIAHSLLLLAAKTGMQCTLACPAGYEPDPSVLERCRELGGSCGVTHDPREAVKGADAIYTDVWTSMGQEDEKERRLRDFAEYQVNTDLLACAPDHAFVTHCLPAHRGEEITDDVLDGPQARALDEAENRLHVQKAVMIFLMAPESATD